MADNSISSMINSLRKQGNLGEALKKAREAKDSNGRVEIPDGNYVCRVTGAKLVPGDKPRVVWNLIVDRGPQKGATVPYRFDLYQRSWKDRKTDEKVTYTLDQAFEDASKNLQRVGVSPAKLPEGDIAAFLNAMLEFPEGGPLVAITARKKGDFVNIYLNRRVEVLFPIEDDKLARYVRDAVLKTYLFDTTKTRLMESDGRYVRLRPQAGEPGLNAQQWFMANNSLNRK